MWESGEVQVAQECVEELPAMFGRDEATAPSIAAPKGQGAQASSELTNDARRSVKDSLHASEVDEDDITEQRGKESPTKVVVDGTGPYNIVEATSPSEPTPSIEMDEVRIRAVDEVEEDLGEAEAQGRQEELQSPTDSSGDPGRRSARNRRATAKMRDNAEPIVPTWRSKEHNRVCFAEDCGG